MSESKSGALQATLSQIAIRPNHYADEVVEGVVRIRTMQPVVPYLAEQFPKDLTAGKTVRLGIGVGSRHIYFSTALDEVVFADGAELETLLPAVGVDELGSVDESPEYQVSLRCLGQVKLYEPPASYKQGQDPDPNISYRTAFLVESVRLAQDEEN